MYQANVYKVFLASPSDIEAERNIAREAIENWNRLHSEISGIVFQTIGWETHSYSTMEGHPQKSINKQILKDADFLIGLFWTKIGTPTEKYGSGTLEEIYEHLNSNKPAMICFSNQPVNPDKIDNTQLDELKKFKKDCQSKALYAEYEKSEDIKDIIYAALVKRVNNQDPFVSFEQNTNNNNKNSLKIIKEKNIENNLSDYAKNLLYEMSQDVNGDLIVINLEGKKYFMTNQKDIFGENPREIAAYSDAIDELKNDKLIEKTGVNLFKITNKGYKVSDLLSKNEIITF